MKFKITVRLYHSWSSSEDYECEIEAADEKEAVRLAGTEALDNGDPDTGHETIETEIMGYDVTEIEGDEDPDHTPPCDQTKEMFT